ncbi:MAG: Rne/Rng family ribonuclease [Phycisphaera sp.]|nr:Rne/Rng family ribonuclease [Phycisphaera sp.]
MATTDMLINHVHGEESRIAIVEDGKLEELYTERESADLHVGNIYRGKVTNVEPSIQAAFVDFGVERAGFLHITDVHPRYFPGSEKDRTEKVGDKIPRRERPPIQKCLKRGQEVLVQVLKEGIGTKGPTVTSYISIPGRYLVMMPNMERHGVSRKVDDPDKRKAMRKILDDLDPPKDFGFIVRTAGLDRPKTELKRDLSFLLRLWKDIEANSTKGKGPAELYTESDLVIRTLRDVLTNDIKRVIVDDRLAALRARQFLRIAMPRTTIKVIHYDDPMPLFDAFDIERQIQSINDRTVPLECGGSLVFDQTEALVAIDVNSGKFRDKRDAEQTAFLTNKDAVAEVARQLRLRDLGGLIVLDLIDMYQHKHRREIERLFREGLKKDRARTKVMKISDLGLLEMTRQRMRPSLKKSVYDECPTCLGMGLVLSAESVVLDLMRRLAVVLSTKQVARVELSAHPDVITQMLNRRRASLVKLEKSTGKSLRFHANPAAVVDRVEISCFDANGGQVQLDKLPKPKTPQFGKGAELTIADLDELDELLAQQQAEIAAALAAKSPPPAEAPAREQRPPQPAKEGDQAAQASGEEHGEDGQPKKRRRRRRRRRRRGGGEDGGDGHGDSRPSDDRAPMEASDEQSHDEPDDAGYDAGDGDDAEGDVDEARGYVGAGEHVEAVTPPDDGPDVGNVADQDVEEARSEEAKPRRRRRRGGRRHRKKSAAQASDESKDTHDDDASSDAATAVVEAPDAIAEEPEASVESEVSEPDESAEAASAAEDDDTPEPAPKKKPRRRRSKKAATAKADGDGKDDKDDKAGKKSA